MSQTIDMPNYTIELSDGLIRPMTVKELAVRSHEDGKGIGDATKTCYADAVGRKISCSDSETFEEIVNILRSTGYEVCGV